MSCEDKQQAFKDKLVQVQLQLTSELKAIETDTEAKAKQIADDFEAENDLAAGVGAVAGTAIGGVIGGPIGGATGSVVGRAIGSLFTMDVSMQRQTVVLDVPQVAMKTQDFSFDLPTVEIRDTDMSFDLPVPIMRRVRGPDLPRVTVRMERKCLDVGFDKWCTDVPVTVVEMEPTYLDIPGIEMRRERIVMGLPTIVMRRQEFKMDVPEFTIGRTDFSLDVPVVTLRFIKDAGKRTAAMAAALAQQAQDASAKKQVEFQDRLRLEAAPLAKEMFACFRQTLNEGRDKSINTFAPEIAKLSASLAGFSARGIPVTAAEYVAAKAEFDRAVGLRDTALRPFDEALSKLAEAETIAMNQFLGTNAAPKSKARGGLISFETKEAGLRKPLGLVSYSIHSTHKQK